jgi:GNAT superfamily N-acetyltransferase
MSSRAGATTPGPSISFAPAGTEDAEALALLRVEAMRASLERLGRFNLERARQRFLSSFVPEHTRHIVAEGRRVGFVVVRPYQGELLLDHLYVRPSQQGRGIGAAVLQQVFAQADAARLPLRVGALRESDSNRFYERHGFVLVERSEWDNHYLRPVAA